MPHFINHSKRTSSRKAPIRLKANSTAGLRTLLEKIIEPIQVVSFDIFDTLLERDIEPPERVKHIVARNLAAHLRECYGSLCSPKEILFLRDQVEADLRRAAVCKGRDHECCFSDIARGLGLRLLGKHDDVLVAKIVDTELRIENEVLYVKKQMFDLLVWLKGHGKRIIAVSDMYLDREHLRLIFSEKGILGFFDEIYVSSEHETNKASGRLFQHVLETEQVAAGDLLHIGDNHHADHYSPRQLGISSIYFNDTTSLRRRHTLNWYARLADRNPYWRGRYLLQLIRPPKTGEAGFHYRYGYSALGPIYAAFVMGAIETLKEQRIDRVFFIAREGKLFRRIFQIFASSFFEAGEVPRESYLYLSRMSTALASCCAGITHQQAILPLFNPNQQGLISICKTYGLSREALESIARRHGFENFEAPIRDWWDENFLALLEAEDFQAEVRKEAAPARALLEKYLAQEGYFSARTVAMVDIGWNGTIQKFVQDALLERDATPYVHGLYLGFSQGIPYDFKPLKSVVRGIFYQHSSRAPTEDVFQGFIELFEEGARALHATTLGYRENPAGGVVEPIFKDESAPDRQVELRENDRISEFHRGVLDFSREFLRAIDLTNYTFEEIKPFFLTLAERCVTLPDDEELAYFLELTHADDFGFNTVMDFRRHRLRWRHLLHPLMFRRILQASSWRYGTIRTMGIPGLASLLRLAGIFSRRKRR